MYLFVCYNGMNGTLKTHRGYSTPCRLQWSCTCWLFI